jgi:hypothetical protein
MCGGVESMIGFEIREELRARGTVSARHRGIKAVSDAADESGPR